MKHWHLIENQHKLARICKPSIIAYKKDKSLKGFLVRAKFPSRVEKSDEKLTTFEWSQLNHQIAHKQEGQ